MQPNAPCRRTECQPRGTGNKRLRPTVVRKHRVAMSAGHSQPPQSRPPSLQVLPDITLLAAVQQCPLDVTQTIYSCVHASWNIRESPKVLIHHRSVEHE